MNGHCALCYRNHAYFGAHHGNLKEGRPILLAAKCRTGPLYSDDIRFVCIFVGVLLRGPQTTVGSRKGQSFTNFGRHKLYSGPLEVRQILLYGDISTLSDF